MSSTSCRGYTAFQLESLSVDPTKQTEGDTKEGLYFGVEVPLGSAVSGHLLPISLAILTIS